MRLGIDIGGTFTDFVLFDETTGQYHTFKTLSTPHDPAVAVLNALNARNLNLPAQQIVHGSTVATNALLERKGAVTALVATTGFKDVLEIGRQNRPDIYDLFSRRPSALVPPALRFEVQERVDHTGQPLIPLQTRDLPRLLADLRAAGVESVAVSLLFSFLYPRHEQQIAGHLRQAGFFVSVSSEVLPEFREFERTSTTVINAYVSPVMDRYLARLEQELATSDFRVMQSNGGSISADQARREAVRCVLSGPAGGVVGAVYAARTAGFSRLLTFDMGGTSTDVSLCDGDIQTTTETEIDGLPVRVPMIDIHTVGSGGGSIGFVDAGGALRVGPESAGAQPGPVCYGQGGQRPTVTDANLILGRLAADYFLGGQLPLDAAAAKQALQQLGEQASLSPRPGLSLAQTAALGVIQVVNAHMERALRVISVQRGHDPRQFTLVSFGGAGGLHAVELARSLGIPRVLVPPNAATLSAFGMLAADVVKDYVRTVMREGDTPYTDLAALMASLEQQALAELSREGLMPEEIRLERLVDMRYRGQSYELTVPLTPDFVSSFHDAHRQAYGYDLPDAAIEVVNLRLRGVGQTPRPSLPEHSPAPDIPQPEPFDRRPVVLASGPVETRFYRGADLRPGQQVNGPAVVVHPDTTIFLDAVDRLTMDRYYNLMIEVGK